MTRILILSFSDLAIDPRVNRQIRFLCKKYSITAAGFGDPNLPGVKFVPIPQISRSGAGKVMAAAMLKAGLFEHFYWSSTAVAGALEQLRNGAFDLVLANEITTVPLALRLNPRCGVILDAHEYSPREMEQEWKWRFFFRPYLHYLCKEYIPRVAGMITVGERIAREYLQQYGVKPEVVQNAPPFADLRPRPLDRNTVRLVHHGGAVASRRIDRMIAMMAQLDERFSLDLFLVETDPAYLRWLRATAADHPRVRVLPPVPMTQLPAILNAYDVGIYILEPSSFNNMYALPNKLFEFIQGRLAVAIAPSPEMAEVVRRFDCGIVAKDFSVAALARELRNLTEDRIFQYKLNSHRAARELCYESVSQVLLRVVDGALKKSLGQE